MARYRGRVSGPLLDRIDLHVEVSRPKAFLLQHEGPVPESSGEVRSRVVKARALQQQRAGQLNSRLETAGLKQFCKISQDDRNLLAAASKQHALSPRACYRILRVARTLADLEGEEEITTIHLAEAISYRSGRAVPAEN